MALGYKAQLQPHLSGEGAALNPALAAHSSGDGNPGVSHSDCGVPSVHGLGGQRRSISQERQNFSALSVFALGQRDVETFVADTLKGENLSKKAKEKRESLIKKIKDVKSMYSQEFQDKGDAEDGDEYDDPFSGPPDTISLASERYDKDDEGHSDGM
ncbi:Src kinase-associated phosphoprotein 2 [Galemys pyrenaicus]|uniref:Src kinase-associated phosphoprotein 2 n=1 Tax=Galemys pyrenaicus TaxID=202257 RepID=A0A8J6A3H7_GALPY|nr:Src kinase-associated phosphoprotein 2 [Galemys pyrenaicus]